jgi:tetratricopeptide (TPR) repeat protein
MADYGGDAERAMLHFESALEVADREGPMHGEAYATCHLGRLRVLSGRVEEGLALQRRGFAACRRRGVRADIEGLGALLARSLFEAGQVKEARALLHQVSDLTSDGHVIHAETWLVAGLIAAQDGQVADAVAKLRAAHRLAANRPWRAIADAAADALSDLGAVPAPGEDDPDLLELPLRPIRAT